LKQLSDEHTITEIAKKILEQNPHVVDQYRSGKTNVISFFVGQVMKQTRGTANPKIVNDVLRRLLEG
ncbi:MAG: aspartyl-tRNA(Asn)/glutamyl-tRNA(Gln) amidotransferase subunit, partial [Pseudothermotoga sp.]|nr:aspartyl-tRNA(Asn)/glutamyl-tRNA(Gln) amidotransferase subunit [Pseudothermotoga sp.]